MRGKVGHVERTFTSATAAFLLRAGRCLLTCDLGRNASLVLCYCVVPLFFVRPGDKNGCQNCFWTCASFVLYLTRLPFFTLWRHVAGCFCCPSVPMIQLQNLWTDLEEIWYGLRATGDFSEMLLFLVRTVTVPTWRPSELVWGIDLAHGGRGPGGARKMQVHCTAEVSARMV
jgi:hypothetical protein